MLTNSGSAPLLMIDDLGMRKLPSTAAEDLLEIIVRRYERASALITSNRPVDDWGKLFGDIAAVSALGDHGHPLIVESERFVSLRSFVSCTLVGDGASSTGSLVNDPATLASRQPTSNFAGPASAWR